MQIVTQAQGRREDSNTQSVVETTQFRAVRVSCKMSAFIAETWEIDATTASNIIPFSRVRRREVR